MGTTNNIIAILNWGAFDHSSHAPQLRTYNYIVLHDVFESCALIHLIITSTIYASRYGSFKVLVAKQLPTNTCTIIMSV